MGCCGILVLTSILKLQFYINWCFVKNIKTNSNHRNGILKILFTIEITCTSYFKITGQHFELFKGLLQQTWHCQFDIISCTLQLQWPSLEYSSKEQDSCSIDHIEFCIKVLSEQLPVWISPLLAVTWSASLGC